MTDPDLNLSETWNTTRTRATLAGLDHVAGAYLGRRLGTEVAAAAAAAGWVGYLDAGDGGSDWLRGLAAGDWRMVVPVYDALAPDEDVAPAPIDLVFRRLGAGEPRMLRVPGAGAGRLAVYGDPLAARRRVLAGGRLVVAEGALDTLATRAAYATDDTVAILGLVSASVAGRLAARLFRPLYASMGTGGADLVLAVHDDQAGADAFARVREALRARPEVRVRAPAWPATLAGERP